MTARHRPAAVVHPQLLDPPIGPAVGDYRDRKTNAPGVTVEMHHVLLKPASLGHNMIDVLNRTDPLAEPDLHLVEVRLECPGATDPPTNRVVQLRLPGEGPKQRI